MQPRTPSRSTAGQSTSNSPEAYLDDQCQRSDGAVGKLHDAGLRARSYYDLYPERKRTGPYVPKATLVAHESLANDRSASSSSAAGRSRSGNGSTAPFASGSSIQATRLASRVAPSKASQSRGEAAQPVTRSVSSTYAASSIALGRARAHPATQQAVKSIDEIVRAHSGSLLSVPPSQRGPQRSASWSTFERDTRAFAEPPRRPPRTIELDSDSESSRSEDSVEQEARTILRRTHTEQLEGRLSRVNIGGGSSNSISGLSLAPLDARAARAARAKRNSSASSLSRESGGKASGLSRKSLSLFALVNTPGARHLQVSFADVGLQDGHPVMVFLGLGASRHLIGLYDDLAASLGLRLVCIDRWGIGRTDHVAPESRSILGWSFVVEQIADLLNINRFSVVAHSAGAPFAVALALILPHRVQGPLHLLAPWTGVQQDSGYRWLRYVPDGVIKTAQAAEWRIQNWKLGKEGARTASKAVSAQGIDDQTPSVSRSSPSEAQRGPHPHLAQRTDAYGESASQADVNVLGRPRSEAQGKRHGSRSEERTTRAATGDGRSAMPLESVSPTLEEVERNTALELLRASHAESARGLVDDLNLVLGKRPWGFDYTDLRISCEVWHGSKDEKIPLSSSASLSKEMRKCTLHAVEGAGHGLMTNSDVVVDVFESILKHWRSRSEEA